MYGMVNRAVEEMVLNQYGEATWARVKQRAEMDVEVFVSNEGYPDDITYRLVAAASEILELPEDAVLDAFGRHWVLSTARDGYGALMDAGGRSLPEFLSNLPGFHARVSLIFPNLKPPRFRVSHRTEQSLHLHYYSHRARLSPFVIGLVHGLAEMYATPVTIEIVDSRERGADHDEFLVTWSDTAAQ